jgi:hypothetical protein
MIPLGPNVDPASRLQLLDYLADLKWHNNQDNEANRRLRPGSDQK